MPKEDIVAKYRASCYQKQIFVQTQAHSGWRFEKVPRVLHAGVIIGKDIREKDKSSPQRPVIFLEAEQLATMSKYYAININTWALIR